ncbi:MAG: alpha/beta hydrolase domain-containing protein [Pseudohongiellaceae bacterium]
MRTTIKTLLVCLTSGLLTSPVWADAFPNPEVEGPIPFKLPAGGDAHDYPFYSQADWLAVRDYVEEEFFLSGQANAYDLESGEVLQSGIPYKTRLVVRRPASAVDFNGTVLLEWQNVTAGYDLDALWSSFRDDFVADGYAWIGISAQRVGVNQLRNWSPVRYGSLDVTNGGTVERDAVSYDIFGQAAQAIRSPQGINVMGGLPIREIIGKGASQSAGYMAPFYNVVMPKYSQSIDLLLLAVGGGETRDDLDVPVFRILSETDVLGRAARNAALPVNSELEITWEIAGTSHSSYEGFVGRLDVFARDQGSAAALPACDNPAYPRVPASRAYQAAYAHMVDWVRLGKVPPAAPFIKREGNTLARDERGMVSGGIQLAEYAVPTAHNTGSNSGSGFCRLYGSHEPYSTEKLLQLYDNALDYLQQTMAVNDANITAGFLLRPGAAKTVAAAIQKGM